MFNTSSTNRCPTIFTTWMRNKKIDENYKEFYKKTSTF